MENIIENEKFKTNNKSFELEYFDSGKNLSNIDSIGNTVLHKAVNEKNYHLIKFILNKKIILNIENNDGNTPLDLALKSNDLEIISIFIQLYPLDIIYEKINSIKLNENIKGFIYQIIGNNEDFIHEKKTDLIFNYYSDQDWFENNIIENGFSTSFYNTMKLFIFKENWEIVKNIISKTYKKQNFKLSEDLISFMYIYLNIKKNKELIKFITDIFNHKNSEDLIFKKHFLDDLFIYAEIKTICDFLKKFSNINPIKENLDFFTRGSVKLLSFINDNYNLNINKESVSKILLFNYNSNYLEYIKYKSGTNNYEIGEIIINYIFENDPIINDFVIDFLSENEEIAYIRNINNENMLNRIIKSNNYEIINFMLKKFPFMINHYNSLNKYALFESLLCSNKEIFNLIISDVNTNIHVFDEYINNILHYYVYNYKNIVDKLDKFKIILEYITEKELILTNKKGNTPIILMGKNNLIDELKEMIFLKKIDENNANYKVDKLSLLDFININIIKKDDFNNTSFSTDLSFFEEIILSSDIVSLSKLLYLRDKNEIKELKFNIVMESMMNKVKDNDIFKLLSFYNFNVNGINPEEIRTPIMNAISHSNIDLALFLIDENCEINNEIEGDNCLSLAVKNNLNVVIYNLLKEKIDVDLAVLDHTLFLKWKTLAEIEEQKIEVLSFTKEKIKNGFFSKESHSKYIIYKNDDKEVKNKKNILNIIDSSNNIDDLILKCNEEKIKIEFIFDKNKFTGVSFNDIYNTSLGLSLKDIKKKIKYNYFEIKKRNIINELK